MVGFWEHRLLLIIYFWTQCEDECNKSKSRSVFELFLLRKLWTSPLGLSGRRGTPLMYPVRSIPLDICSSNHLWTGARGNFQQHSINTVIFIRDPWCLFAWWIMHESEEKRRFLAIKKIAVFSLSVALCRSLGRVFGSKLILVVPSRVTRYLKLRRLI